MVGDLPPGEGPTTGPPPSPTQWSPVFPTQPQARPRTWPTALLAGTATVLAIAALIVALTRPTATKPTTTSTAPTYSAAEISGAERQFCDTYKLGAQAVQADTNGHEVALGRIALTNAAAMLEDAATNPALGATYRDPARALAASYRKGTAMGNRDVATDAQFQAALDDINAKDAAMKKVCGGG
ncbi:hypothetical protein A5760_22050 [Mycobacterium colombiense]|uniref:Alanine and proline rich membrane protein n=1 Tax=Mycobacterium colombiense TaxID=339268 RepID=A0A1A0V4K6_9MYCO|nr:hypothetical protein [Mycobacterium colombiense]OBB78171.1 hypothetical protein A5760_22050 [Mycobacterium colombiense]